MEMPLRPVKTGVESGHGGVSGDLDRTVELPDHTKDAIVHSGVNAWNSERDGESGTEVSEPTVANEEAAEQDENEASTRK